MAHTVIAHRILDNPRVKIREFRGDGNIGMTAFILFEKVSAAMFDAVGACNGQRRFLRVLRRREQRIESLAKRRGIVNPQRRRVFEARRTHEQHIDAPDVAEVAQMVRDNGRKFRSRRVRLANDNQPLEPRDVRELQAFDIRRAGQAERRVSRVPQRPAVGFAFADDQVHSHPPPRSRRIYLLRSTPLIAVPSWSMNAM